MHLKISEKKVASWNFSKWHEIMKTGYRETDRTIHKTNPRVGL